MTLQQTTHQSGARPEADRLATWRGRHGPSIRGVSILRFDPDLAAGISAERLPEAERLCVARTVSVRRAPDLDPGVALDADSGFGLFVLSGALCRRITQEGRIGAELIGPGDLMRPSDPVTDISLLPLTCAWRVVTPARLALLDLGFARRAAFFPEVAIALNRRSLRRNARLATLLAALCQPRVESRLTMLFWHLADRFGKTCPDGRIRIPLPLTHGLLAEMVAARRPSVTTALARLREESVAERDGDGWLLSADAL